MFREISRNKKQILSKDRAEAILEKGSCGVLSLLGDDDYTYGVPMSYSYRDGRLYFHSAVKGHKIDAINKHDRVSFTVIETDQVVPAEFTTYYRSVIAFGKIRVVDDLEQMRDGLKFLVEKYSPDFLEESKAEIESSLDNVRILIFDIEHISGKEAIEFAE